MASPSPISDDLRSPPAGQTPSLETLRTNPLELTQGLRDRTVLFMNNAVSLVAALAWNELFKSLFAPRGALASSFIGPFMYACLVTLLAVVISNATSFVPPEAPKPPPPQCDRFDRRYDFMQ